MIDLHSHTTFSDGQHPPERLIELAAEAGVTVLALTDHDSVAGVARAQAAAAARGITLIPGIEISVQLNRREIHVLGHFVDPSLPALATFSEALRGERRARMVEMVEKVNRLGLPVTLAEVERFSGDGEGGPRNLGRPHLARALLERGWVADVKEAFDRFLGAGKPAFVERDFVSPAQAIGLITEAGGVATLAHPGVSKVNDLELKELAGLGLGGLEVDHSDHVPSQREKFRATAAALGLICTAGSDFHGEAVAPGRKLGTADMGLARFEQLRAKARNAA